MWKIKKDSSKKENRFDKWVKANRKSNVFIGLIVLGLVVRMLLYLYFGARFLVDVTFVIAILLLLILITNKFNYKEPKQTSFRKILHGFTITVLAVTLTILYADTFIGGRDIYTIVANTDEEFIYSYDLEGQGRRYFTTSSEDVSKVDKFPVYELSNGKIVESYFVEAETGLLVDEKGELFVRDEE